jgi:hypothetical protein
MAGAGSSTAGRGTTAESVASPLPKARPGADCLQRPLRSRFQQQLRPSVAMTSDVKVGQQILSVFMMFVSLVHRQSRSQP